LAFPDVGIIGKPGVGIIDADSIGCVLIGPVVGLFLGIVGNAFLPNSFKWPRLGFRLATLNSPEESPETESTLRSGASKAVSDVTIVATLVITWPRPPTLPRAELEFRKATRQVEAEKAMTDHERTQKVFHENRARLRAERLSREEATESRLKAKK
jgi:hypothetical protein